MADAVGRAEAGLETLAQPDALEQPAGEAVAHVDLGGNDAGGFHRIPSPQLLEGPNPIG